MKVGDRMKCIDNYYDWHKKEFDYLTKGKVYICEELYGKDFFFMKDDRGIRVHFDKNRFINLDKELVKVYTDREEENIYANEEYNYNVTWRYGNRWTENDEEEYDNFSELSIVGEEVNATFIIESQKNFDFAKKFVKKYGFELI